MIAMSRFRLLALALIAGACFISVQLSIDRFGARSDRI